MPRSGQNLQRFRSVFSSFELRKIALTQEEKEKLRRFFSPFIVPKRLRTNEIIWCLDRYDEIYTKEDARYIHIEMVIKKIHSQKILRHSLRLFIKRALRAKISIRKQFPPPPTI